ncbi:hypothetical protein CC2G_004360 [Coprinopsis cinerea AmutBmut pab1-1]|nr:hypothetical protein CC2G_004360 [Coprinopsis cinerea AmutBmut pab1-1]
MSSPPPGPSAPPSPKLISYLYEFWEYVSSTDRWPEAYHNQNKADVMSLSRRIYFLSGQENYRDPKYIGSGIWSWWSIATDYIALPQNCPLEKFALAGKTKPPLLDEHPRPPKLLNYVENQILKEEATKQPQPATTTAPPPPPVKSKKAGTKKTAKKREPSEFDNDTPPPKKAKASASDTKIETSRVNVKTEAGVPETVPTTSMSFPPNQKSEVPSTSNLIGGLRSVNDLPTGDVRHDLVALLRQQRDQVPKVNEALSKYETILEYCTKERDGLLETQGKFEAFMRHSNMTTGTHDSHFTSIFSRLAKLEDRDNVLARIFAELTAIKEHLKSPNRTEPFDDMLILNSYDATLAVVGSYLPFAAQTLHGNQAGPSNPSHQSYSNPAGPIDPSQAAFSTAAGPIDIVRASPMPNSSDIEPRPSRMIDVNPGSRMSTGAEPYAISSNVGVTSQRISNDQTSPPQHTLAVTTVNHHYDHQLPPVPEEECNDDTSSTIVASAQ